MHLLWPLHAPGVAMGCNLGQWYVDAFPHPEKNAWKDIFSQEFHSGAIMSHSCLVTVHIAYLQHSQTLKFKSSYEKNTSLLSCS